jgi:hypothetical protein
MSMSRVRLAWKVARQFGAKWLAQRLAYVIKKRSGWIAWRFPAFAWTDRPLASFLTDGEKADDAAYAGLRRSSAAKFFFDPAMRESYAHRLRDYNNGQAASGMDAVQLAESVLAGRFLFFGHEFIELGKTPAWHRNVRTGAQAPSDRHWSLVDEFEFGDIKFLWEPSRFAFTYALVRAYWRTGEERFAEAFWSLLEDWRDKNPPNCGVNWQCGQETSVRLMAWCFGMYGFRDAACTTERRIAMLGQMIAVAADRIESNIGYALSQQNNHSITEAVGLWTVGLLFPEFKYSARRLQKSRELLEELSIALIYPGGGFSQHSFNYQRVMLQAMLWAMRLGEVNDARLPNSVYERVAESSELLYQVQDAETGRVPCYGANDGALVLPLSDCDYRDYRPVVQAMRFLTRQERSIEAGPWDEDLLWLFGPDALHAPLRTDARRTVADPVGGYAALRSAMGFAFARSASFRHRPSQADELHVDVWWEGQNVACDPGSYSYNAPPPWDDALGSTAVHNTVTVDGQNQMTRAGRFLWLNWARAAMRSPQMSQRGRIAVWQGEHDGYRRLQPSVVHARCVCRIGEAHWLVVDRLTSAGPHDYRLHWLWCDAPYRFDEQAATVMLDTAAGPYHVRCGSVGHAAKLATSVVRADETSTRGWQAPYYGAKEPAVSFAAELRAENATLWTLLGPPVESVLVEQQQIRIAAKTWRADVDIADERSGWIVRAVELVDENDGVERLELN